MENNVFICPICNKEYPAEVDKYSFEEKVACGTKRVHGPRGHNHSVTNYVTKTTTICNECYQKKLQKEELNKQEQERKQAEFEKSMKKTVLIKTIILGTVLLGLTLAGFLYKDLIGLAVGFALGSFIFCIINGDNLVTKTICELFDFVYDLDLNSILGFLLKIILFYTLGTIAFIIIGILISIIDVFFVLIKNIIVIRKK